MEIDSHSTTPQAAPTTSVAGQQRELFVVQRCWHSGPHQYQPLDLMRLFLSQRDAEEAAYHSAHAWCRYHRPDAEPQVKTLLLPSYPSHNTSGSSYGFIAHGNLFWVRSLYATTNSSTPASDARCSLNASEGYAVVTEGVIGGTGNRMSRRGTEVPTGRVFVPESGTRTMMMMVPVNSYAASEVMRRKALETCHYVMAQLGSSISTNVATLPVGRPAEYTSGNFLKDWPPQVLQPTLLADTNSDPHKRGAPPAPPQSIPFLDSMRTVSTYEEDDVGVVVECPFEMPAAKRRRFCDDSNHTPTFFQPTTTIPLVEDDVMMMNYGVAGEQA
jgi:hypothetical protein